MSPEQHARVLAAAAAIEEVKQEVYFEYAELPLGSDAEALGEEVDAMDRALDELDGVLTAEAEEGD